MWKVIKKKKNGTILPRYLKKKKKECKGRSHWLSNKCFVASRMLLQQCPHVRLSLSWLVWRHEPGTKSNGCRTEFTAPSVGGFLAVWPWGDYSTSLCLHFLTKEVTKLPSQSYGSIHWNIFNVKTWRDQFHCWDFLYTKSKQGNGTYNILKMSVLT